MINLCTIGELSDRVGRVLSLVGGDYQASGRITAVPDIRTLRYYTTLGLLSPPEETRGRTALYGRRHLAEAVAIKRLQSSGESLQSIQQRLLGATATQLEQWANIPASIWDQLDRSSPEMSSPAPAPASSSPEPAMQASFLRAPDVEESAPIDSQPESISKFWSAAPESPRSSSTSGQLAFQWELVPGVRVTWDDASQAGRAAADPDWRRAVSALAFQAARIVVESGDELA
jgi:DNA-binding transcriptional MerR regulator